MPIKHALTAFIALTCWAMPPDPASAAAAPVTADYLPGSQTVVLSLPAGVVPDARELARPARFMIELPGAAPARTLEQDYASGVVSHVSIARVGRGTRMVLRLRRPLRNRWRLSFVGSQLRFALAPGLPVAAVPRSRRARARAAAVARRLPRLKPPAVPLPPRIAALPAPKPSPTGATPRPRSTPETGLLPSQAAVTSTLPSLAPSAALPLLPASGPSLPPRAMAGPGPIGTAAPLSASPRPGATLALPTPSPVVQATPPARAMVLATPSPAAVVAIATPLDGTPARPAIPAATNRVTIGTVAYDERIRILQVPISAAISPQFTQTENPPRLTLDLIGATIGPTQTQRYPGALLTGISAYQVSPGLGRLVIDLARPIGQNFLVKQTPAALVLIFDRKPIAP